jgi:hypothetical protein
MDTDVDTTLIINDDDVDVIGSNNKSDCIARFFVGLNITFVILLIVAVIVSIVYLAGGL